MEKIAKTKFFIKKKFNKKIKFTKQKKSSKKIHQQNIFMKNRKKQA